MNTPKKDERRRQRYEELCAELMAVVNDNRLGFELSLKACIAVAASIVNQEHTAAPLEIAERHLLINLAGFLLSAGAVPVSILLDGDLNAGTRRPS